MKYLIVVDMQNDFVDGALGTKEAEKIVHGVAEKIRYFDGRILYTKDTRKGKNFRLRIASVAQRAGNSYRRYKNLPKPQETARVQMK